ncbi:hypothetical protein ACFWV1_11275 [Streptomyces sp. NPDC058700]|uniref:hypothetical protein n=1 Tax=unclassified Streptomyces TaxID=2593676 RepID=UPI003657D9AC
MAQIAVDAAGKAAPLVTGGGGNVSALGGMLNQGGKAGSDTTSWVYYPGRLVEFVPGATEDLGL